MKLEKYEQPSIEVIELLQTNPMCISDGEGENYGGSDNNEP
jgi:hypothetical protein